MTRSAETERVARLLAPLTASKVEPPPADTAYWQARVRLALEEERRRQASVLRPLRTLHIVMGFATLGTAVTLLSFSAALGLYAAPLIFAAFALGARLFSEATPAG